MPERPPSKSPKRLVLLTSVWKRPALTRIILNTYRRLQRELEGEIEIRLLAVGSEGEASRSLVTAAGFEYLEHPNSPLSHKWNAGVRATRALDPDAVVILGSDDLIGSELLRAYARMLDDGLDFFGISDLYFYDLPSGVMGYWAGYAENSKKGRAGEPIGCGRCLSRALLERTSWNLWPDEPRAESLLDGLSLRYLERYGFRHVAVRLGEIGAMAIDVKTETNITPFETIPYAARYQGDPAVAFLRKLLPQEDLEALFRLREKAS